MKYLKEYNQHNEYYYSVTMEEEGRLYDEGKFVNFTPNEVVWLMGVFRGYNYGVYGPDDIESMNYDVE
jgi:hypothetical protein